MIFTPPTPFHTLLKSPSVFLAGSIDMGNAVDWQSTVGAMFDQEGWDVLNPRRSDWDSSWEQSIKNQKFAEQVSWEREGLFHADYLFFYFQPGTLAPISMFELGNNIRRKCYYTDSSILSVVCPEGFWRKGNVDLECAHYGVDVFETIHEGVRSLLKAHAFDNLPL